MTGRNRLALPAPHVVVPVPTVPARAMTTQVVASSRRDKCVSRRLILVMGHMDAPAAGLRVDGWLDVPPAVLPHPLVGIAVDERCAVPGLNPSRHPIEARSSPAWRSPVPAWPDPRRRRPATGRRHRDHLDPGGRRKRRTASCRVGSSSMHSVSTARPAEHASRIARSCHPAPVLRSGPRTTPPRVEAAHGVRVRRLADDVPALPRDVARRCGVVVRVDSASLHSWLAHEAVDQLLRPPEAPPVVVP